MTVSESSNALLTVNGLCVRYGAGPVVHDAAFSLGHASVGALLGTNGAGKSSVLRAIAGLAASQGKIVFDGTDISHTTAAARFRRGVVYVPEGRAIVTDLSVRENLVLGAYFVDRSTRERRKEMVLEFFPEIANRLRVPAGLLSGGEQQMLAIGRGLMSGPRLLLLDEPSLGLAPLLVARVYDRLARIQSEQRLTVLLVEQSFHVAAKLASHAWVMRHGAVVGHLDETLLRSKEGRLRAIDAYLGARIQDSGGATAHQ
nr:ABC transporter ATP-binding protein [Caballeronia sp. GAFFF2]